MRPPILLPERLPSVRRAKTFLIDCVSFETQIATKCLWELASLLTALRRDDELLALAAWAESCLADDRGPSVAYTLAAAAYARKDPPRAKRRYDAALADLILWNELGYLSWQRQPAATRQQMMVSPRTLAGFALDLWRDGNGRVRSSVEPLLEASLAGLRTIALGKGEPPSLPPGPHFDPQLEPWVDPEREPQPFLRRWKQDYRGRLTWQSPLDGGQKLRELACLLASLDRWTDVEALAALAQEARPGDADLVLGLASLAAFGGRPQPLLQAPEAPRFEIIEPSALLAERRLRCEEWLADSDPAIEPETVYRLLTEHDMIRLAAGVEDGGTADRQRIGELSLALVRRFVHR